MPVEVEAKWCRGPESNWRHYDFQSYALPTELPRLGGIQPAGVVTIACPSAARQSLIFVDRARCASNVGSNLAVRRGTDRAAAARPGRRNERPSSRGNVHHRDV